MEKISKKSLTFASERKYNIFIMKKGWKENKKFFPTKRKKVLDQLLNFLYNMFSNLREDTKMENAKVVNYTDEMVAKIVAEYVANPTRITVDNLAETFGKPARSIIAKLSAEGVYRKAERVTKAGTPIVKKEELVAAIQEKFGVEVPTLVKASKQDLEALVKAISG